MENSCASVERRISIENRKRNAVTVCNRLPFLRNASRVVISIALFCDNSVPNTSWKHHNLESYGASRYRLILVKLRMRYEIERTTVVIVYRRANVFLIRICPVITSCETLIFIRCLSCLLYCDASLIDADPSIQSLEQHYQ